VIDKVHKENIEANARSHHIFTKTLKQCLFDMTTRKVELLLSRIQGFKSTHKRRTTTKDY